MKKKTNFPGSDLKRRIRISDLVNWKRIGEKWVMLTAYDFLTAQILDNAGIPVILVGDSAANLIYGYKNTTEISNLELLVLARAVVRGAPHALVVADLVFGSYEINPETALNTALKLVKKSGVQAIKIEGGKEISAQITAISKAGIPVFAHIGFTPQKINSLNGYKIQGKTDAAAKQLLADADAVANAGAAAVVLEMVPAKLAAQITEHLAIPVIGIGAGSAVDAQVLVWQDMAGMNENPPKFVKQFAQLKSELTQAAQTYAMEVQQGKFPTETHEFS